MAGAARTLSAQLPEGALAEQLKPILRVESDHALPKSSTGSPRVEKPIRRASSTAALQAKIPVAHALRRNNSREKELRKLALLHRQEKIPEEGALVDFPPLQPGPMKVHVRTPRRRGSSSQGRLRRNDSEVFKFEEDASSQCSSPRMQRTFSDSTLSESGWSDDNGSVDCFMDGSRAATSGPISIPPRAPSGDDYPPLAMDQRS
eukprot:tig00020531_g10058.t1